MVNMHIKKIAIFKYVLKRHTAVKINQSQNIQPLIVINVLPKQYPKNSVNVIIW